MCIRDRNICSNTQTERNRLKNQTALNPDLDETIPYGNGTDLNPDQDETIPYGIEIATNPDLDETLPYEYSHNQEPM